MDINTTSNDAQLRSRAEASSVPAAMGGHFVMPYTGQPVFVKQGQSRFHQTAPITWQDKVPVGRYNGVSAACGVIERHGNDSYRLLINEIEKLLNSSPNTTSLKQLDELYNRFFEDKNCEYSTGGVHQITQIQQRISTWFFDYLQIRKEELVQSLKINCHRIDSNGGADRLFKAFMEDIKRLHSEFTPRMQDLLCNVGFLMTLDTHNSGSIISGLVDKLKKSGSLGRPAEVTVGELNECNQTASVIINRQGKTPPSSVAVLMNYLARLTNILGRPGDFPADRDFHLKALECTASAMKLKAATIDTSSDSNDFWHYKLFKAIIDARFSSEFMNNYQDIFTEVPLQQWNLDQLTTFIDVFRESPEYQGRCSPEFKSLLSKMFSDAAEPSPGTTGIARSYYDDGNNRATEHCESLKPFTEKDREEEFRKFLHAVDLEVSGEFSESKYKYDEIYSGWREIAQIILGQQASVSPDARRALELLASLSNSWVKVFNHNFFDTIGDTKSAKDQLAGVINAIKEKNPDDISIRQTYGAEAVSVHLWKEGKIIHTMKVFALTQNGIPFESMAMQIQLLCGRDLMTQLFSFQNTPLSFRHNHSRQLTGSDWLAIRQ